MTPMFASYEYHIFVLSFWNPCPVQCLIYPCGHNKKIECPPAQEQVNIKIHTGEQ